LKWSPTPSQRRRRLGGFAVNKQGGAGEHARLMAGDDAAVDAVGEAEVIAVDNQSFHVLRFAPG
jgi:hypothetical protein